LSVPVSCLYTDFIQCSHRSRERSRRCSRPWRWRRPCRRPSRCTSRPSPPTWDEVACNGRT